MNSFNPRNFYVILGIEVYKTIYIYNFLIVSHEYILTMICIYNFAIFKDKVNLKIILWLSLILWRNTQSKATQEQIKLFWVTVCLIRTHIWVGIFFYWKSREKFKPDNLNHTFQNFIFLMFRTVFLTCIYVYHLCDWCHQRSEDYGGWRGNL